MKKITVAIDSLKGSLTSMEAGKAIREGIRRVYPEAEVQVFPIADGGEGTTEALIYGMHGKKQLIEVQDPLGRPVMAMYGIIEARKLAVIEMASAAGITHLKAEERNPLLTTTYGVGQMIRDAIQKGCRSFLVGIGGSATNDGGVGMLQALGFDFLNKNGNQIGPGAESLSELCRISKEHVMPELAECTFRVACDVTNPLCGELGCSEIYARQKGADDEMIRKMDRWLSHYADMTAEVCSDSDQNYPGAGAAGGLGFAFLSYTKAKLESGISIILKEIQLEEQMKGSDLVVTGEGMLDSQTIMGKAPVGVAKLAKKQGIPVIAFSGAVSRDAGVCNEAGIDAFFPIIRSVVSLEEAMNTENARRNMEDTVEQVFRLMTIFR